VARRSNPARLVLALSVAAVLAVFLVYVSFAGGGTPAVEPSELNGRTEAVVLSGKVVPGAVQTSGEVTRFRLRDVKGSATVRVSYAGGLPDQFKAGRDLRVNGQLRRGVFVGEPGTMVTKCPSKYVPKQRST
jgi:cytochrome c-type biogenesis protein CcmE